MYVFSRENVFILTQGNTDLTSLVRGSQSLGVDPEGQNDGASRRHAWSEPTAPALAHEPAGPDYGAASPGAAASSLDCARLGGKVGAGRCAATGFQNRGVPREQNVGERGRACWEAN